MVFAYTVEVALGLALGFPLWESAGSNGAVILNCVSNAGVKVGGRLTPETRF